MRAEIAAAGRSAQLTAAGSRAPSAPERPAPPHPDDMDAGAGPITAGMPLPGERERWVFQEIAGSQCRDGSPAGVFLNFGTSKGLMIFLEGGGRCVNAQTCAALTPSSIRDGDLVRSIAFAGVLDRSKPENPVRDWSFVMVPYCTGDRHGGANPDGMVSGVGPQRFVGYTNMQVFLPRIVATFPDASDVVLTGISAGGFGVAYLAPLVQRAFPHLLIKPIIDSAPFASIAVFQACDQKLTRELSRADRTYLGECGDACANPDDYWLDYASFFGRHFGDRPWGLLSTTEDVAMRAFFGIGVNDCQAALDFVNPGISADTYSTELLALRSRLSTSAGFATFYEQGNAHTFLAFDDFYSASAGGVRLVDWFAKIVHGEDPGHAGP